jgi:arylsulfatase A-like enzyme
VRFGRPQARLLIVTAVLAGGALWYVVGTRRDAMPPRVRVDEVLVDLTTALEHATVLEQAPGAAVRVGALAPSHRPGGRVAYRPALVVPPPASVRYRLRVPAGAALELAAGVAAPEGEGPVAFAASIDGRQVFARVIDPRGVTSFPWQEARIDLASEAGREVELVLTTRAASDPARAGTPGWSRIRLVRSTWRERQDASPSTPSVLVLLVDSLRADRLGCYGATPSPTPALDALAKSGVVFEQAIAQAPWTLPAVATLFTGLHPASHGVVGGRWRWGEPDPSVDTSRSVLADSVPTLAALARRAGITTAGFTASGLVSPITGLTRGFEHFVELTGNPTRTRFARAGNLNRRFLRWLAQNRTRRVFAYLHYMDTHSPYEPPEGFRPRERADLSDAVRAGKATALRNEALAADELAHLRALYHGTVRYWDAELGRLVRGLADLGLAESTVVVVLADHGEAFQEHGYLGHGVHLHEELLRVPFVIAGPGIGPARRVPEQVQQVDFLPTVAGLLGIEAPPGLPGQAVLARFDERPAVTSTVFWQAPDGSRTELLAWRTPAWKLLHAPETGHYELYDLAGDPRERADLFGERPEGTRLASALASWRAALPPPPAGAGEAPELGATLHALGYIE